MSKYTRELRWIVESEEKFPPPNNVLSLKKVLNEYPLHNENFIDPDLKIPKTRREVLNEKIIEHFYFREVCCNPTAKFLFMLKRKLNEIMITYNQRYMSTDLEYNPLYNVEMTETFTHTVEGNGTTVASANNNSNTTNTLNSNSDNLNVNSNTPNQELSEADIKSNKWASSTSYDKGGSTNNSTSNVEGSNDSEINTNDNRTETYTRFTEGSSAGLSFSRAVEQWRQVMLNIDMEIIEELEILFMGVW